MNKIKIILSCIVILLLIGGGITTVMGFAQPPKPTATVQMRFDPQSLTMKRGESRVITIILDCCLLENQELGKIETVKIGMLASGYSNTAIESGITTKFNPEYLDLKIGQTKYSYLTVSVDNTTNFGICATEFGKCGFQLVINLYNDNSTPEMYVGSHTPYPGGANSIYLTIIDTGLAANETAATTANPTALQSTIPTVIPKTPAFDALSVILVLLAVLIIKRN